MSTSKPPYSKYLVLGYHATTNELRNMRALIKHLKGCFVVGNSSQSK